MLERSKYTTPMNYPTSLKFRDLFSQTLFTIRQQWRVLFIIGFAIYFPLGFINQWLYKDIPLDMILADPMLILQYHQFYILFVINNLFATLATASIILLTFRHIQSLAIHFQTLLKTIFSVWGIILVTLVLKWAIISGLFFVFIIPGILWFVYYTFTVHIILLKKKRFIDALSESKKMVKGRWWEVLGVHFVLWFFYFAIVYIFSLLTNTLLPNPDFLSKVFLEAFNNILTVTFTTIFLAIYFFHLNTLLHTYE